MRVLHLTDTHLGSRWAIEGAPRGFCRSHDHAEALERALAPVFAGEVDAVVHTGDVFDRSRPPSDAIATARAAFGRVGAQVPVVMIPGNHDRRGLAHTLGDLPGVEVHDAPARVRLGELWVGAVPYVGRAAAWSEAARVAVGAGVDLLLAHEAFHGVRVPGFTFRAGARDDTVGVDHLPPGVRDVACGHLHPRQIVHVGAARVVCPGSTERTALSEASQRKGYAMWTRRGGSWDVSLHDLPVRPVLVLSDADQLDHVVPGALVRCPSALAPEVHARGGWILPHRSQLSLFG